MSADDHWERFARRGAEQYILTGTGRSPGPAESERFFESGRRDAAWMLEEVEDLLPGGDLAIEIGCGVGRLLIPLSRRFARVIGVDVAPTMLAKLGENSRRFGAANVEPALVDEPWDRSSQADFACSWLVFQHVADATAIERLLGRLAAALKPAGAALLQFDTRPRTLPYRLRNTVPDALLPWAWRRGIRRIRRAPGQVAALLRAAGLRTLRERGSGTARHVFVAVRG